MTAAGAAPARSSSSRKVRPSEGFHAEEREKVGEVTQRAFRRSGSPAPVRVMVVPRMAWTRFKGMALVAPVDEILVRDA